MTEEEEFSLVHQKVGEALNRWNEIEMRIMVLFCLLVAGKKDSEPAQIVFFAIDNFRAKQKALNALCSVLLKGELLQKWTTIENHLSRRAAKRNRIAHSQRAVFMAAEPGRRVAAIPPVPGNNPIARRALDLGELKPMYLHELDEAIAEFRELSERVSELIDALQAPPAQLQ